MRTGPNTFLQDASRLLAVDPSLACSGWALFSLRTGSLIGIGKIKASPPSLPMAVRLREIQEKVGEMLQRIGLGAADLLLCEAQTTMRDPRAALAVEQVRGIFEAVARMRGAVVPGRLNPRTVHGELLGMRGTQLARDVIKASAVSTVQTLFARELSGMGFDPNVEQLRRHQDIVDAILVGSVALSKIDAAVRSGVPVEEVFEQRPRRRRPKG